MNFIEELYSQDSEISEEIANHVPEKIAAQMFAEFIKEHIVKKKKEGKRFLRGVPCYSSDCFWRFHEVKNIGEAKKCLDSEYYFCRAPLVFLTDFCKGCELSERYAGYKGDASYLGKYIMEELTALGCKVKYAGVLQRRAFFSGYTAYLIYIDINW